MILIAGDSGLVLLTNIAHGCLLRRPQTYTSFTFENVCKARIRIENCLDKVNK